MRTQTTASLWIAAIAQLVVGLWCCPSLQARSSASGDDPLSRKMVSHVTAELAAVQRGRPQLNESRTTFVGDNGQLLRGHFTSTEWGEPPPRSSFEAIKELGSNAVHLYAEAFDPDYPAEGSQAPGYSAQRIDRVVEITRELGLYLVITIGNGAANGRFNYDYVMDFWDLYAPRYKDETHVVYEIQNEPVAWSPPYSQAALDMELDAYNLIRSHAPDTPILLFSYSVLGSGAAALQDLDKIGESIDWSNAGIAFHGYAGYEDTIESVQQILDAGYPCMMTEFTASDWGHSIDHLDAELTAALERMEISWLSFLHIPPNFINQAVTEPSAFFEIVEKAGLSWVPDYGSWPVARGVFGNEGLPRSTTGQWIDNRLTGALRVQAEDFDVGGQSVAYFDTSSVNEGGQYRAEESVDIRATSDGGDGYAVGGTEKGEWLEYTIFAREPGYYDFGVRYAASGEEGALRAYANGQDITGRIALASTGEGTTWATVENEVFLEYGRQKLRLEVESGGFDLNWIELSPAADGPIPDGTYRLINRNSGLAMEGDDAAGQVVQAPYSGDEQEWMLEHLGAGQYRVRFAAANRYWSVFYQENEELLDLVGWWNLEEPRQRYLLSPTGDGFYFVRPAGGGLSLEVAGGGTESGALVQQHRYTADPRQQWAVQASTDLRFPTGLSVEVTADGYALSWEPALEADSFSVMRSRQQAGPYATIATGVSATDYLDTDVVEGEIWYYVVTALVGGEESLPSAAAAANPPRLHASFGFDEGAGVDVFDDSDSGWRGSLQGGAGWAQGREQGAVVLDGDDGHVLLPDGIVSELSDFTISTWVYLDTRPTWSRIFDFGSGTGRYMFLSPSGGGGTVRFAITSGSGEQIINSQDALPTGEWTHVAVSLEGTVGVLYVNGVEVGRNESLAITPADLGATDQNYIGRSQWVADPYLDGRVDDFRIYSNAFDAEGVLALFEAEPRPAIQVEELLAPRISVSDSALVVAIEATVPGRRYRLLGGAEMTPSSWFPLSSTVKGDGGELQFIIPLDQVGEVVFVRVGIRK